MKRPTRSAAVGLAAALGLTVAVIPGVVSAAGEAEPFVSTLTLDTRATPQLTLEGTTFTQALTTTVPSKNDCNLATDSRLITFTGLLGATTSQDVGFKGDSLGVNEKIASVCNRVDNLSGSKQPETLQLELASGLEVVPGSPVLGASSASLDIEVASIRRSLISPRERAMVEAQAFVGTSTTPVGTWTLVQGTGTTPGVTYCNVADNANCRLEIDPVGDATFTRLTLKATKGSFSLEGGSDAVTPATTPVTYVPPTTFELVTMVDKVFKCVPGTQLNDKNATVTYVGSVIPDECAEFGATLTASDTQVQFLKPLAVDPTAQFEVNVEWKLPGTETPSTTLPPAFIDFEVGAPNENVMGFCPDTVVETDGRLSTSSAGLAAFDDYEDALGGTQFACIFTRSAPTVNQTEVIINDRIFLIGDAKMRL